MLGIFDFKDALRMLFKLQEACKDHTLNDFRDKRLGIDFRFLNYFILMLKNWTDTDECMRIFKEKLTNYGIDFTVVFKGVEFFKPEYLVRPFYYIQWTREKYFFFNLIYQYLTCRNAEHEAMMRQILSIRFLGREDTFVLYSHYLHYQNYFVHALESQNINFLRAPQFIDHQLLYLLNTGQVDYIKASPLSFLIGELESIIAEVDIDTGKVVTYEWEMFRETFQIDSSLLKRCLLGSMMYFLCHSSVKADNKFCKSIVEKIENFPAKFHELAAANMKLMLRHIEFLKTRLDPDAPIDENFCTRISNLFNLEPQRVTDYCGLLFNSVVMSRKTNSFPNYPIAPMLPSTRLLVNTRHPTILFLFCRQFMDEELFSLLNDCLDHKAVIFCPRFEFVEFAFAYKSYFKEKLEQGLSQIIAVLPEEANHEFKFRFFADAIVRLQLQPFARLVATPDIPDGTPVNPFTVLYGFYEALTRKTPLVPFEYGVRPPATRVLAYLRLSLLSALGYCNPDTGAILVAGAGFLEAGAHAHTQDLLVMFELLRNSLMKPDFFTQEKPVLVNYEELIKDNVFESIIKTVEDIDHFLNEFSIHDQSINEMISGQRSTEVLSDTLRHFDRPSSTSLKHSLTKCLNMYYKVIKDFQAEFLKWHQPQPLFICTDEILSAAFKNAALVKVQIISRIFSFACCNYVLDDFFDIDTSRYEAIINVVKRGLNAHTIGSLIFFLYNTGLQDDFGLIEEVCRLALIRKNYSTAAGTLTKILMTKYLIYKVLERRGEEFAPHYRESFNIDFIKKAYLINFDLFNFMKTGKALFVRLYKMLKCVNQYHKSDTFDVICDNAQEIIALINGCTELLVAVNKKN